MSVESETNRFGQYEVPRLADGTLCELGRGAMGVTYRAFDTKLKVDVVVKLIHSHFLKNERIQRLFLREARAAAKVRHPNIAAVVNLHDEPPFYYTMEFVAGQPLSAVLKARERLPVAEALDYADQTAAALGALARERIVHRDLKPSNLMLVDDPERPFGFTVKVIDFGLAKGFTDEAGGADSHLSGELSQPGIFSGTPFYASPEQCATQPEIDTRSDLYSVGVILWQMLLGTLPFNGTFGEVLAMHQFKAPPWEQAGHLPFEVVEILRRLLEKKPDARFQSPRELRDAISGCRFESPAATPPDRRNAPATFSPETRLLEASIVTDIALGSRYRLVESFPEGDGGKLYRGIDLEDNHAAVGIKILSAWCADDEKFLAQLQREIGLIKETAQPIFLASPLELELAESGWIVVREWATGVSLLELLRARRTLTPPEIQRLLAPLPGALDEAAGAELHFPEPLLHKLFVTASSGNWAPSDTSTVLTRPVSEWRPFHLRWNPLTFHSPAEGPINDVTRLGGEAELPNRDPVVRLARLIRELLGGRAGGISSLSTCSEHANAVLRRALAPGGGQFAFASAADFWGDLFQESPLPATPVSSFQRVPTQLEPGFVPAAMSKPMEQPARSRGSKLLAVSALVAVILVFGLGSLRLAGRKRGAHAKPVVTPSTPAAGNVNPGGAEREANVTDLAPLPAAVASASEDSADIPRSVLPAPTPPPANPLGLTFVQIPGTRVLCSSRQIQRSDFAAFLKETGYTPRGTSVDPNWRKSILDQPDAQPIVNLTFGEARGFCTWLTQREHSAGRLQKDQVFRLPTNLEWALAAGEKRNPRGNKPNRVGVFDGHGPISDWCEAPRGGGIHIIRGGAQQGMTPGNMADLRSATIGFRIVLDDSKARP